ncbi:LysR family transcriptional regulator [Pseudomonas sp. NFR16]|uniref:LysR family transcriptional regulator n=1 Tax=Pseudomonas sp. NFR16 TaxID=1566248 RepID=UPI00352743F5
MRSFFAFAHEGSLAAAALALGVEHATVARRIAAPETSLNMKLVDRRGRVYPLTEDGVRVAEYAAQREAASFVLLR